MARSRERGNLKLAFRFPIELFLPRLVRASVDSGLAIAACPSESFVRERHRTCVNLVRPPFEANKWRQHRHTSSLQFS